MNEKIHDTSFFSCQFENLPEKFGWGIVNSETYLKKFQKSL
jgi:hypothetical protein